MASFCQYCGSPLSAGMQYCQSCGQPVPIQQPSPQPGVSPQPGAYSQYPYPQPPQSPPPPYYSQPPQSPPPPYYTQPPAQNYNLPQERPPSSSSGCGRTALIVIIILFVLSLCCASAIVGFTMITGGSILNQFKQFESGIPSSLIPQTTLEAMIPTQMGNLLETAVPGMPLNPSTLLTAIPDLTALPANPSALLTALPSDPSALLTALPALTAVPGIPIPPLNGVGTKSILLDYSSGWKVDKTDQYLTDITQQGDWVIAIVKPGLSVAVLPPNQPGSSASTVTVTMKLSINTPDQGAGVRCMVQDAANYYQVEVKNKSFAISKVVNGKVIPLTSPPSKPSQFMGAKGLVGGADIIVTCTPYGIGITVNGMEETHLVPDPDSSFSSGKVAIFASPITKNVGGIGGYGSFGKVKIESSN